MADQSDRSQLPPGWECRYDIRSGRPYFINHFNCATSWEDPRVRYWQYAQYVHGQNSTATNSSNGNSHEAIPLQSGNIGGGFVYSATHRAPQVYPSPYNNPQPAFLPCLQDLKTPMSTSRSISATTNKFGDMTIGSPTPMKNMESSFIQGSDVELQVAKINAIFPTVSDTHIRLLLKKYLKNVFPKVDETLLLDILEQSDNNVQKASEKLIEQGYEKKNPTGPSKSLIRPKEDIHKVSKVAPTPPPRMKSAEEKTKLKTKLMEKYKSVPDRVIALAMDSVDYDEEKAVHILDIMIAEEAVQPLRTSSSHSSRSDERKDSPPITEAIKLTASPIKKIPKDDADKSKRSKNKIETHKISRGTSTTEDSEYKSPYITKPIGANPDLAKGPDNDLLLPDYAPWAGPDTLLLTKETTSIKSLAVGRDLSLVSGSCGLAKGPNADLRKGPLRGLAQGSIYSQRNAANTESRGK
ncbi:uncharacterized protein LOC123267530 isoform X3 [Cotesia glomerata]|uniref:uncharacterized protein LOC123267530 isoform X3 n=1 Tax=Cotesia glomerata TaxID=32391 RepID=UPI001D020899|nr:uncharacterized protein LOC123267530 isoform X3 [Cotesia glomerata]